MSVKPADRTPARRARRSARLEDAVHDAVERRLRRRGWHVTIVAYTGYAAPGWARVMARLLLSRMETHSERRERERRDKRRQEKVRGWRSYFALPVKNALVVVEAGGQRHEVYTDRGGFVDCVVTGDFKPEWDSVRLHSAGAEPVDAPVRVVDPDVRFGIISDVDDTVMVTALPRPMLAAWNSFVLDEHARMAVPGMAVLYERLATAYPGAPVFYLSTGAFNVAPALTRFLDRHLYPAGPLLLTDWGPTQERWFRSGREHKVVTLARLAAEFPDIRWLLVGDDGQHDQEIYAEFATAHPQRLAGVAIRHLSPTEAVLARGLPTQPGGTHAADRSGQTWLYAPDGAGLWRLMREVGLVSPADAGQTE